MPAARKASGFAHFKFKKYFCSLCLLQKADINNLEWRQWPQRSREDHMKAAEAWRDAPSRKNRANVFSEHGVRWSVLLLLEYFDPTKMVVVDSMHNLFLGIVQYHFREILNIDKTASGKSGKKNDKEEIVTVGSQYLLGVLEVLICLLPVSHSYQ
jgi:hypothetical protein